MACRSLAHWANENEKLLAQKENLLVLDDRTALFSGFAKSRPARPSGQRPTARRGPAAGGPLRPGGPAARRPTMALEARWPSPDFQQFFCQAVNPNACADLHRVSACNNIAVKQCLRLNTISFWPGFPANRLACLF